MALIAALSRGGAVFGAIFLIVALLKRLIIVVGFLIGIVKFAIIIVFIAVLVMIALAIYRDRQNRKSEL